MLAGMQESPGDPRHLIGDGDTGLIDPNPCHQLPNPGTLGIGLVPDMADDRERTMIPPPRPSCAARHPAPPTPLPAELSENHGHSPALRRGPWHSAVQSPPSPAAV